MSDREPALDAHQHQAEHLHIRPIVELAQALEGILPAVRALATGGAADLVESPSMYAEAPPPWLEEPECMVCIRVATDDPNGGCEYLDLEELGQVAESAAALREPWLLLAGPDAFNWRPYVRGE